MLAPLSLLWLTAQAAAPTAAAPTAAAPTADPAETAATWPSQDFVVVPLVGVNVDEGFGLGAIGAFHRYQKKDGLLRDDLALRLFFTTRLVQRHEIHWEGIEVLDLPVRAWVRLGLFSTVTQTYCGVGNGVTCDVARARADAAAAGLSAGSPSFEEFVRRYYFMRFIRPYGDALVRVRVKDGPRHRMEWMGGVRISGYIPGDFLERGPYPGSLYEKAYQNGEPGLSNVLQLGITIDDRDFEPAPTRGYFAEASVRGSSPYWGSSWSYAGVNASVAGYLRLWKAPNVVLAQRLFTDVLVGDPPTEELALTGGTRDYAAFGGQWMGRGMRDHRYLGRIKVIDQLELRADLFDWTLFGMRFDIGAAAFGDAGWIGFDFDDFGGGVPNASGDLSEEAGSPWRIVFGTGLGLRILLNRAILLRIDVAVSPFEQVTPAFYTPVGFPF